MKKLIDIIKHNLKWIILFSTLIGFIALFEDVYNKEIMRGDIIGYHIISSFISDNLTPIIKIITNFGSSIVLIIITIISLIFIKNKKIGTSISLNLIIITILNVILKNLIQRERPTEFRIVNVTGYSFPSGHSMISMAFFGFLIYLIYRYVKNKYLKWTSIGILSILIISIGLSRIYLGVHYTSDVIAGFLISLSYLTIYIEIIKRTILSHLDRQI